jgi:anti-sigma factor RsiW
MINHLSDEELICFIDNEPSTAEPDRARSHLEYCSRCHKQLQELLSTTEEFERLLAQIIPTEFPPSDLYVSQLRCRLAELPGADSRLAYDIKAFLRIPSRQFRRDGPTKQIQGCHSSGSISSVFR